MALTDYQFSTKKRDADGKPLALSDAFYQAAIAPREELEPKPSSNPAIGVLSTINDLLNIAFTGLGSVFLGFFDRAEGDKYQRNFKALMDKTFGPVEPGEAEYAKEPWEKAEEEFCEACEAEPDCVGCDTAPEEQDKPDPADLDGSRKDKATEQDRTSRRAASQEAAEEKAAQASEKGRRDFGTVAPPSPNDDYMKAPPLNGTDPVNSAQLKQPAATITP